MGITRTYIHHELWEDWINGMWRKVSKKETEELLPIAIKFTANHIEYGKAMKEVVDKWENTMLNSLTNNSINRKAFVGHCACSFKLNLPESIVRLAWKELSETQRTMANLEAEKSIIEWERNYKIKSTNTLQHGSKDVTRTGYQMQLQLE